MYQKKTSWLLLFADRLRMVVVLFLIIGIPPCAQTQNATKMDRTLQLEELNGGSTVTKLGFGIQINKGSSLQRRWFVLNDSSCPVRLSGAGITTVYQSSSIGGDYEYKPVGTANASEPITAFELRFLLFDVWGQHMETLSGTQISDYTGQIPLKDIGTWRAGENDVSEMLTVVTFVARAKKPDGSVWEYDPSSLLEQVEKLTEKELTPEREKPKS